MKSDSLQFLLKEKLNLLLQDIKLSKEGILNDYSNPIYLHDFRVSIRKIRVYLTQLNNYFNNSKLKQFKKDFRYLAKLTNETRDLDVYILKFNNYKDLLPKNKQNNLNNLIEYLKNKKEIEYKNLVKILQEDKYKNLIEDFDISIISDNLFKKKSKKAIKVAFKNLSKLYTTIIEDGCMLDKNSPNSKFHKLRIKCKKLRYLIELFSPLYCQQNGTNLIKELKVIQTLLGDFNDFEVHQHKLKFFVNELNIQGDDLSTINILIERFEDEQNLIRDKFHNKFKNFKSSDFKKDLLTFQN